MTTWTTGLPDWEERIVAGKSLIPCDALFPKEAEEALKVFKSLRVVDAVGQPTFGETGEDWVFDFVSAVFGAYDPERGERLINEFFLCVSKKNGKSTIAAGIMLTALIRNWRTSNELIIVAPTIKAADNSFKPAADMVRANPGLDASANGYLHVIDHQRTIKHLSTGATLRILAADTGTVAGNKAAFVLVDELWEFGSKTGADSMMREAAGGLIARPEGFLISITTQSDEPPAGIFKSKLTHARKVRDGIIEDKKFLPVLYEFPRSMVDEKAYLDPRNFYITNPHLAKTEFGRAWIREELAKELEQDAATRNVFLAKHLNIEIGQSLLEDRWGGAEFWEGAADETLTLEELIERSEVITIGIDGGGLDDLLGLSVIGREKETRHWLVWCHAFANPVVLERRKQIASTLRDFEREGSLTFSKVPEDIAALAGIVEMLLGTGKLPEKDAIGIDPNNVGSIIEELAARGCAGDMLRRLRQGPALSPALWGLERKLSDNTLRHDGSAMMAWCVGNVKVEVKGNGNMATKQAAGRAKIDPFIAMLCAAILMSWNPEAHREPQYQMYVFG